ncbi:MAG: hypothetical protein KF745_01170 [Phycisphaeraceae bacterium]|nr:hypothetical protein [Phycisphaeraceae bacterium]
MATESSAPGRATPPSISAEQAMVLDEARARAKKLFRAGAVAKVNGWTAGVFGVTAVIGGVFSWPAMVLGLGLCVAAWRELRGAAMMRRADVRAPSHLAWNQALIIGAIAFYCVASAAPILRAPEAMFATGDAQADELLRPYAGIASAISLIVYGAVAVLTALSQGLLAMYYLSRRRTVAEYRSRTPGWAVEVMARAAA